MFFTICLLHCLNSLKSHPDLTFFAKQQTLCRLIQREQTQIGIKGGSTAPRRIKGKYWLDYFKINNSQRWKTHFFPWLCYMSRIGRFLCYFFGLECAFVLFFTLFPSLAILYQTELSWINSWFSQGAFERRLWDISIGKNIWIHLLVVHLMIWNLPYQLVLTFCRSVFRQRVQCNL